MSKLKVSVHCNIDGYFAELTIGDSIVGEWPIEANFAGDLKPEADRIVAEKLAKLLEATP